jgi:hypothetical protein
MRLSAALAAALLWSGGAYAQTAPGAPGFPLTLRSAASDPIPASDPTLRLLDREAYVPGAGPVQWMASEIALPRTGSAVDSLQIRVGGVRRGVGGLPFNLDRAPFDARDYEVTVAREWPRAVSFDAGPYDLDLSPHAGLGVSSVGGSAEAGAMLRLSVKRDRDEAVRRRLAAMGVRDGSSFGESGRWYLFAAASGRAVGLNLLRGDSGWTRAGWSTDPSSALIGDAQVGVGWRKGDVQTSLGFIHREVKGQHMIFGQETRNDSLLAFSFAVKPGR